ncbi:MAG: M16 family metallopeptidase, partial [Planctomycetota bacterium]
MIRRHAFYYLLVSLLIVSAAFGQELKSGQARAWEHETSDIAVNPRIKFGKLSNGMRFAWMANAEPQKRCYVRIHINAGSFAENEDERGMAHFLEHMCFNGSKNFPAETLVEWFQKHGMAFGADTNAFTAFAQTVYQLDLPNADEVILSEGLKVFRDFADGLLIEEKEVTKEKGVVDSEERERDSAQYRALVKSLEIQYSGTRVPSRLPIGTKNARDQFSAASVRKFYETWYRPENMTLVIVGDLKDLNPEKLIHQYFDGFKAPLTAPKPEPPLGVPSYATKEYFVFDKDLPATQIGISLVRPWTERAASIKNLHDDVPLDFAREMLNIRFSELAKKKSAPFANASVADIRTASERAGFNLEEGEALQIVCQGEQWEKAIATCEYEVRRAIEFGFDESELEEVKARALRSFDEAVEREKTRASTSFLQDILDAAENRSVPTTAEVMRNILKPAVEKVTIQDIHAAFKKAWSEGTLLIGGTGNIDLGADAGKKLRTAYEESIKKPVKAKKKVVKQQFAYASDPAMKGEIETSKKNDEFDFSEVVFKNGVRVFVKKTDFKEKQIIVSASVGEGSMSMEPGNLEMQWFGGGMFSGGGLGKHSVDDLRKLTAGKQVGASLAIGEDSFVMQGATTKEDLLLQFELMTAHFTDPGWRDDGLQQILKQIPFVFQQLKHLVDAAIEINFMHELYNRDARHRGPDQSKAEALAMESLKSVVAPQLADAPVTISVVGDLDVDATISAIAQTFGNLPKRREYNRFDDRRVPATIVAGKKFTFDVDSEETKTAVQIVYPTTDGRDTATRRKLSWLASVLNDRLRIDVREKLGASYSPSANSRMSRIYPEDGIIAIRAGSDPEQFETLIEACIAAADTLATKGATEEELNRAREPELAKIRDAQRTNGYWAQNFVAL